MTAIDALRGLIMVIMALDHVRDFVHRAAMASSPTDLATTTPILFFTRWITHFCAPVFMFTAGLGAFLWWQRGRTRSELSVYLLTRGLWLAVLELTVMRLAYNFSFSQQWPVFLLVLWVLGICMIALAALVWIPTRVLAVLSLAMIALHNTLDGVTVSHMKPLWNLVHQPGAFQIGGTTIIVGYQLVPWIAVMALGFCCGALFQMDASRRRAVLLRAGAAAAIAFVIVRAINVYGDPAPWSSQPTAVFTLLSFLNTTKYPPSLLFLLMTLGPALLVLAWFDSRQIKVTNPLVVIGRVPLFFFVVHFLAAHLAVVALSFARYGRAASAFVFNPILSMGGPKEIFPAGFGWNLWVVYAVWAAIVVGLYPACKWFAGVKGRRREWWMSYL